MKLKDLIKDHTKIDDLLSEIDSAAKEECSYEYGLPLYSDAMKARMREIVYKWLSGFDET